MRNMISSGMPFLPSLYDFDLDCRKLGVDTSDRERGGLLSVLVLMRSSVAARLGESGLLLPDQSSQLPLTASS